MFDMSPDPREGTAFLIKSLMASPFPHWISKEYTTYCVFLSSKVRSSWSQIRDDKNLWEQFGSRIRLIQGNRCALTLPLILSYLMAVGESLWPACSHTPHCKMMKTHWAVLKSPATSNVPFLFASVSDLTVSLKFTFVSYFQGWEWQREKNIFEIIWDRIVT